MLDKLKALLTPDVSVEARLIGVSLFIGRILSKFENRIGELESRQLQRGERGEKGDNGNDGVRGKDGKQGKDGRDGQNGKDGAKGDTGDKGEAGEKGVSVVDAEVALDGNLVLNLSNGEIIDAGKIVQPKPDSQHILSTQLANYQITVSSNQPVSPQVNDLWLEI